MNALLDTCVLSEYAKRAPHAGVIAWLDMQPESGLFISSLSLAEIEKGILKLAGTNASSDASNAKRAEHLTVWLGKLTERFADRTLPVDAAVWRVWAQQAALAELQGQTIAPMDGLLMATAQCHGLTVVTRNVAISAQPLEKVKRAAHPLLGSDRTGVTGGNLECKYLIHMDFFQWKRGSR